MPRKNDLPRLTNYSSVNIPPEVKVAIWFYFDENRDKVVLKIAGFFKVTIGMLEPVFIAIAGPRIQQERL